MRDFLYPLRVLHGILHEYRKERKLLSATGKRVRSTDRNTVLFVMTPTHGNLGDHAIALAVSNMLRELNIPYLEITHDELKRLGKHHKMGILNGHPILVNGGGNIGTLWPGVEKIFRSVIQDCPDSPILCLPNSAYFEQDEKGQQEYALSRRIYQGHKRLMICAREQISYELLKQMLDPVILVPDMVLSLNRCQTETERKGCVLCLRSDRERTRSDAADQAIRDQAAGLFPEEISYSDMNIGKDIPPEHREAALAKQFDTFSHAELVITDRLHGMIFAAVTGTPCIVLDSKSPKVRGCYEWIRELGYIRFADSPAEIQELYRAMPRRCTYTNAHLQSYYKTLKQIISQFAKSN